MDAFSAEALLLAMQWQSSQYQELPLILLTEPDVSLSTHPAPIVQPDIRAPSGETRRAAEHEVAAANPRLSACEFEVVCICAAPNALGSHPEYAGLREGQKAGSVHSSEPNREGPAGPA